MNYIAPAHFYTDKNDPPLKIHNKNVSPTCFHNPTSKTEIYCIRSLPLQTYTQPLIGKIIDK